MRKDVPQMRFSPHAASHMLWFFRAWEVICCQTELACLRQWTCKKYLVMKAGPDLSGCHCSITQCPSLLACFTALWSQQCLQIAVWFTCQSVQLITARTARGHRATIEVSLSVMHMYVTSQNALFIIYEYHTVLSNTWLASACSLIVCLQEQACVLRLSLS